MDEYTIVFATGITEKRFWLTEFFDDNEIPYKISFDENDCDSRRPGSGNFQYYWVEEQHKEDVLAFIEEFQQEVEFEEDSFDEGFFDSAEELGDMEFSEEYEALSEIRISDFLERADISYLVKSGDGFQRALKRMFKSIAPDMEYRSYEGGRVVQEREEVSVNDVYFNLILEIKRESDSSPFVVTCTLEREDD